MITQRQVRILSIGVMVLITLIAIPVSADLAGYYWTASESTSGINIQGDAVLKTDKAVYVGMIENADSNLKEDIWLVKYSHNGTKLWKQEFADYGTVSWGDLDIVKGNNGHIYLGYTTHQESGTDGRDVRIAKFNPDGSLEWHKKYDGSGGSEVYEHFYEMVITDDNHIIAGFTSINQENNNHEMGLVEFNESGGIVRAYQQFISDGHDLDSITIYKDYIYVGGEDISNGGVVVVKVKRPNLNQVWNFSDATPAGEIEDVVITSNKTILALFRDDASSYWNFYGLNLSGSKLFHSVYTGDTNPIGMVPASNNTVVAWDDDGLKQFYPNATLIWANSSGKLNYVYGAALNESGIISTGINYGPDNALTYSWITDTQVEEEPPPPPPDTTNRSLELDVPELIKPNKSAGYSVTYINNSTVTNVTAEANVTSANTSVITVNESEHTLYANASVNTSVNITANYTTGDGATLNDTEKVVVATLDIENLTILPPNYRPNAALSDSSIFFILLVVMVGVLASMFVGPTGAIGAMQLAMVIGWYGGYVTIGITMVSLFVGLFIGLNTALNVDYAVG